MVSSRSISSAKPKICFWVAFFPLTFNKESSSYNFSTADLLNLAYFYLGSLNNIIFFSWTLYGHNSLFKILKI